MSSRSVTATSSRTASRSRAAAARRSLAPARARGIALIVGGILTARLLKPIGGLEFYWLPLFTGATYLAAALLGGPRGPLWGPGVIVGIFGLEAVLTLGGTVTGVPDAPGELLAVGIGIVVLGLLRRAGVTVDLVRAGVTTVILAAFYYAVDKGWLSGLFVKPALYGAILAGWGLWELRPGGSRRSRGR